MEVKVAKTAGFCYGVERAVNMVYEAVAAKDKDKDGGKIYTYGPIVHNETVVRELSEKGAGVINSFDELKGMCESGELKGATVIIRAHGVGTDVTDFISDEQYGVHLIDATCPFVKKIHNIVKERYDAGDRIIITGAASHPEVIGILGQINGDAIVLENLEDAKAATLDPAVRYTIVSQTTFNFQKFKDIIDFLGKKIYYGNVVNTICDATERRQTEAYELSRQCDMMIVIGGRNSSNTAKLFDICSKNCGLTQYIGSLEDFDDTIDSSVHCIGITAGASTPKTIIQEVLKYVRDEF